VSTAAQLRTSFFEENLRDLNRLVFAAEALEAPKLPEVPNWERERVRIASSWTASSRSNKRWSWASSGRSWL
jgi:hypothetical protein